MSSSCSSSPIEHQARLQLQQRGDQHDELGGRLQVQLAALLEVVEVGEHDLRERELEQVDLFAQHEREQQVERAGEDLQVELERGEAHALKLLSAPDVGAPKPMRSRTSASVSAAIALRARGAVAEDRLERVPRRRAAARSARARARGSRRRRPRRPSSVRRSAPARTRLSIAAGSAPRTAARISIRLLTPGLSGARRTSSPESVTALLSFFSIALGSSSTYTVPCSEPTDRGHLARRVLQVHDPRADLRDAVLGHDEHVLAVAEARVEAPRRRRASAPGARAGPRRRAPRARGRRARRRPAAPDTAAARRRRARAGRATCRGTGACAAGVPAR